MPGTNRCRWLSCSLLFVRQNHLGRFRRRQCCAMLMSRNWFAFVVWISLLQHRQEGTSQAKAPIMIVDASPALFAESLHSETAAAESSSLSIEQNVPSQSAAQRAAENWPIKTSEQQQQQQDTNQSTRSVDFWPNQKGGINNNKNKNNESTTTSINTEPVVELSAFEAAKRGYFRHSMLTSVILTIAYSIVFVIGIIGNSLVVAIVYKSPRMRTVTNYFIANLAFADILVLLFCLPATLVGNLFIPYVLGLFVCKTVSYLQGVAVSASINTMVTVTLDRFLAIYFPMYWHMSRHTARWVIACIWLFSACISAPWAIFFTLVPYPLDTITIQVCAEEWPSDRWDRMYFVCANLVLLYLLPAAVIIICYLGIWYKIECRKIPGDRPKSVNIELIIQRSKLKVVKMMMVVVVIFLLSWLPLYLISARIKLFAERSQLEELLITNLMPLAQWLGASNSCINPILYTFFNRKYKRGFADLLQFAFCCQGQVGGGGGESQRGAGGSIAARAAGQQQQRSSRTCHRQSGARRQSASRAYLAAATERAAGSGAIRLKRLGAGSAAPAAAAPESATTERQKVKLKQKQQQQKLQQNSAASFGTVITCAATGTQTNTPTPTSNCDSPSSSMTSRQSVRRPCVRPAGGDGDGSANESNSIVASNAGEIGAGQSETSANNDDNRGWCANLAEKA